MPAARQCQGVRHRGAKKVLPTICTWQLSRQPGLQKPALSRASPQQKMNQIPGGRFVPHKCGCDCSKEIVVDGNGENLRILTRVCPTGRAQLPEQRSQESPCHSSILEMVPFVTTHPKDVDICFLPHPFSTPDGPGSRRRLQASFPRLCSGTDHTLAVHSPRQPLEVGKKDLGHGPRASDPWAQSSGCAG